jgi:hypothetical protein
MGDLKDYFYHPIHFLRRDLRVFTHFSPMNA